MLRCGSDEPEPHLPMNIGVFLTSSGRRPMWLPFRTSAETSYDAYANMLNMLSSKSSKFVKGTRVSELDLVFGNCGTSPGMKNLAIVLQWLLAVSAWKANITAFDSHLQRLSNAAMSNPSLKTFRPIPTLRQNVADLRDAVQREKDNIGSGARAAFTGLAQATKQQLESLDSVFETLLKESDALSAKASNEIQLVIGSVTILVLALHHSRTGSEC